MTATARKNIIWIAAAVFVTGGIFTYSIRSALPRTQAQPVHVKLDVETQVEVAPDGVATMHSKSRFTEPPVLSGFLRQLAEEQRDALASQFENALVDGLAEQPWKVGGVAIRFVTGDPNAFTADFDVTLYHYSWVESAAGSLWYSPGIVTRQDGILSLISFLESMGRPVSDLTVHSTGIAYWPAGAHVVETLPKPGQYSVERQGLTMKYLLKVYTDDRGRPVVQSQFDFGGPRTAFNQRRLRDAFEDLLARANVDRGTRNVYIRYRYPVQDASNRGPGPRTYREAPTRPIALALLSVFLATGLVLHRQIRKRGLK